MPRASKDSRIARDATGALASGNGSAARAEITAAIIFYDGRGWDWLPLVGYLTAKANGDWPPQVIRTRIGV